MNDITNETPVPQGAYRINLEAWTETDGKRLKVGTSIEHHKDGDSPERIVMEKVIDLEDAAIREGLQALGWIAPKPVDEAIARLNASLQPQPQIEASATMRDALIEQGWVPPELAAAVNAINRVEAFEGVEDVGPFVRDLVAVLTNVRQALQRANDDGEGTICDTIWHDATNDLIDYIDATLEAYGVKPPKSPAADAQKSLPL